MIFLQNGLRMEGFIQKQSLYAVVKRMLQKKSGIIGMAIHHLRLFLITVSNCFRSILKMVSWQRKVLLLIVHGAKLGHGEDIIQMENLQLK